MVGTAESKYFEYTEYFDSGISSYRFIQFVLRESSAFTSGIIKVFLKGEFINYLGILLYGSTTII